MPDAIPLSQYGVLSTLSLQTMGIVFALLEELAESGAIDRARLLKRLDEVGSNPNLAETPDQQETADKVMGALRSILGKARD